MFEVRQVEVGYRAPDPGVNEELRFEDGSDAAGTLFGDDGFPRVSIGEWEKNLEE